MEAIQWTLLTGLIAMLVYVLWHRLRHAFVSGVAPQVRVDWAGEAVVRRGDVMEVHLEARKPSEVRLAHRERIELPPVELLVTHLDAGTHRIELDARHVPAEGWLRLTCPGHVSERKVRVASDPDLRA